MNNTPSSRPSKALIRSLLEQVDRLVLVQTNVFIRELLRDLGKRPGANKEQFRLSLEEAIIEGKLTQKRLNIWLHGVEGWGNQNVYPFSVPKGIVRARAWKDEDDVASLAEDAFPGSWRADTSHYMPADPEVVRTDYRPDLRLFVVEWHERTDSWTRDKGRDGWPLEKLKKYAHPGSKKAKASDPLYQALLIDGDTYRFKAERRLPARSVMRFGLLLAPRLAENPIGALFLRVPVNNKEHAKAVSLAWRDLGKLIAGGSSLGKVKNNPWNISDVIKKLDDKVTHKVAPNFKSKKTKFSEGEAWVQFSAESDLTYPHNIGEVKLSIPAAAIEDPDFVGSEGDFRMQRTDPGRATSRPAHVELFQADKRMRIWTELEELDVWGILETLDGYR